MINLGQHGDCIVGNHSLQLNMSVWALLAIVLLRRAKQRSLWQRAEKHPCTESASFSCDLKQMLQSLKPTLCRLAYLSLAPMFQWVWSSIPASISGGELHATRHQWKNQRSWSAARVWGGPFISLHSLPEASGEGMGSIGYLCKWLPDQEGFPQHHRLICLHAGW